MRGVIWFLFVMSTSQVRSAGSDCPWYFDFQWQQSCYYVPYREASRPSAVDACQAVASHLVYIETQEEQTALEGWLYSSSDTRSSFYWIGLEGTSEDDVTWLNGDRTNYTNFEANTAFAAVSTYIGMEGPTFTWHNLDSTSIEKSICEKENDQDNGAMNQNGQECPHPFTYEWQQSCYYFSISRYSITYSSSFCEYLSSHLVYIESEAEEAAIFSSLSARNSNGDHWIGLTGSSSTDVTWQDGKSPNYTNFRSDSFDGFGANFVLKYPDYYWDNGGVVNTDSHFICEQELGQQDQDTVEDEEEVTNVPGCPYPFQYSWSTSCYYISDEEITQIEAVMYCQEHHSAHLVYIETEEEQATLQDWLPSSYFYSRAYWIGLQGTSSDDVAWLDGTKPNYTNFAYNSFDGPDGHYFRMKSPEFHWHDQIGTYSDYFICEMEGDVTMTQEPNPELNPSTDDNQSFMNTQTQQVTSSSPVTSAEQEQATDNQSQTKQVTSSSPVTSAEQEQATDNQSFMNTQTKQVTSNFPVTSAEEEEATDNQGNKNRETNLTRGRAASTFHVVEQFGRFNVSGLVTTIQNVSVFICAAQCLVLSVCDILVYDITNERCDMIFETDQNDIATYNAPDCILYKRFNRN
ncbi:macrophage mannose receptor 1-like isoform X2 [Apostichopus japonicus]|uniref:macrophage mannose receptor 1-like isoform X2 n=1 Tax=Stichopus japonicus TaxID=307972 RepID=UPI003AB69D86